MGYGFCGLALLGILVLAWFLGSLQGRQNEQRQSQPHHHALAAISQAKSRCAKADLTIVFECVLKTVEAEEETARSEQDLTAQQRAAWANVAAAIIAFVSLPIGGFGLWALLRTIRQGEEGLQTARKTNESAEHIGKKQVQAYAYVTEIALAFQDFRPLIAVKLENHGQSPASEIEYSLFSELTLLDFGVETFTIGFKPVEFGPPIPRAPLGSQKIVTTPFFTTTSIMPKGPVDYMFSAQVSVKLRYKTVFDEVIVKYFAALSFFYLKEEVIRTGNIPVSIIGFMVETDSNGRMGYDEVPVFTGADLTAESQYERPPRN